ncbi:MAG: DUF72 domain-containing protein [Planctomycetaceae bacterium]
MGTLLYGTSSWSEKSWVGPFYPEGTAPGDYLTHYATRFSTVEADVTYYRVPDKRMVAGWDRKTPEGFLLSAKFPRSVVHGGEGATPDPEALLLPAKVDKDVDRFLEAMRLLGPKCGPLVLQFPYFNRKVFSGAGEFFERLDPFLAGLPDAFRYGVEVRNRAWIGEPLLALLKRHKTALVLVELAYLPHPADLAKELDLVTTDFLYARLIGDRKAVEEKTETFDRIVLDRHESLERWAALLKKLLRKVPRAFVYANNHYAGHGPATIEELAALVKG